MTESRDDESSHPEADRRETATPDRDGDFPNEPERAVPPEPVGDFINEPDRDA